MQITAKQFASTLSGYCSTTVAVLLTLCAVALDEAIRDYTEAIRLDPADHDAYFSRGEAHRDKGETEKAIVDFDNAIKNSHNLHAYYYSARGNLYRDAKRDYGKAISDYSEAIRLDPKLSEAYLDRGRAVRCQG